MGHDEGQTSREKNACCGSASSEMSMSTVLRGTCRDVGVYQQKAQRKSDEDRHQVSRSQTIAVRRVDDEIG